MSRGSRGSLPACSLLLWPSVYQLKPSLELELRSMKLKISRSLEQSNTHISGNKTIQNCRWGVEVGIIILDNLHLFIEIIN